MIFHPPPVKVKDMKPHLLTAQLASSVQCAIDIIHTPGYIQSYGLLFVLDEPSLKILQVSSNVSHFLHLDPQEILGTLLNDIFPPETLDSIQEILLQNLTRTAQLPGLLFYQGDQALYLDASLHRYQGMLFLELEPPCVEEFSLLKLNQLIEKFLRPLQTVQEVDQFCQTAAQQFQELTGFDRVMIYQFDKEWNGAVIAEAKNQVLESFLGLHFPATDIPALARTLFKRNDWWRYRSIRQLKATI